MTGQIDMMFNLKGGSLSQVRTGRSKIYAVRLRTRLDYRGSTCRVGPDRGRRKGAIESRAPLNAAVIEAFVGSNACLLGDLVHEFW